MDSVLSELQRILVGGEDAMSFFFYIEIILRTAVMYFYTMFLSRMVGQSGIGQLGPFEFVLVIAVGSAAGDPMFYPDVGLLQGIVVITMVILLHRATGFVLSRNRKLEGRVEGEPLLVVREAEIVEGALGSGTLTKRELMSLLRLDGVRDLGEVELAFFEPSGKLSIFRYEDEARLQKRSTIPDLAGDGTDSRVITPAHASS